MRIKLKSLTTKRLLLRPFVYSDAISLYNNITSDTEVMKYVSVVHKDISETQNMLRSWITQYGENEKLRWAVTIESNEALIGVISVIHLDMDFSLAEIAWCFSKKYWHQGFASESLLRVIEYLRFECGIDKIEAAHHINNTRSGAVMKRCGMKFDRLSFEIINGNVSDFLVYSISNKATEI